ncbi:hypothetical protein AB1N83_005423 [Pleurotus pulmonarius]
MLTRVLKPTALYFAAGGTRSSLPFLFRDGNTAMVTNGGDIHRPALHYPLPSCRLPKGTACHFEIDKISGTLMSFEGSPALHIHCPFIDGNKAKQTQYLGWEKDRSA